MNVIASLMNAPRRRDIARRSLIVSEAEAQKRKINCELETDQRSTQ
jgi:hypothetical protein